MKNTRNFYPIALSQQIDIIVQKKKQNDVVYNIYKHYDTLNLTCKYTFTKCIRSRMDEMIESICLTRHIFGYTLWMEGDENDTEKKEFIQNNSSFSWQFFFAVAFAYSSISSTLRLNEHASISISKIHCWCLAILLFVVWSPSDELDPLLLFI